MTINIKRKKKKGRKEGRKRTIGIHKTSSEISSGWRVAVVVGGRGGGGRGLSVG